MRAEGDLVRAALFRKKTKINKHVFFSAAGTLFLWTIRSVASAR